MRFLIPFLIQSAKKRLWCGSLPLDPFRDYVRTRLEAFDLAGAEWEG